MQKSSLDIVLLPESKQDRQMAALMKLQTKSANERESEKRLDILMQPALPGATTTTFGGLKRQKALISHLAFNDLGIKKSGEPLKQNVSDGILKSTITSAQEATNKTIENPENRSNSTKSSNPSAVSECNATLVNLPTQSLALVCDYASSASNNEDSD